MNDKDVYELAPQKVPALGTTYRPMPSLASFLLDQGHRFKAKMGEDTMM